RNGPDVAGAGTLRGRRPAPEGSVTRHGPAGRRLRRLRAVPELPTRLPRPAGHPRAAPRGVAREVDGADTPRVDSRRPPTAAGIAPGPDADPSPDGPARPRLSGAGLSALGGAPGPARRGRPTRPGRRPGLRRGRGRDLQHR